MRFWKNASLSGLLFSTAGLEPAKEITVKYSAVLLLASAAFAQLPTSWTPELTLQLQGVAAVTPSPDGRLVAWTQSRHVMEPEKSETITQIWLARIDGSNRFQLTRGEKSAQAPSFSPDSAWMYFTSPRPGKNQVFRIPVDGGEAEQVTTFKDGVGKYQLSPDGKTVAFTGYEEPASVETSKKQKRDWKVIDDRPRNEALYVIPAEADANGKRTHRKIYSENRHVQSIDWSPDSKSIVFEHWPQPEADYWTKADMSEVQVENASVGTLLATGAAESSPRYSPDGRWIAFVKTSDPPRWPGEERLALFSRSDQTVRSLPATHDENPAVVGWSADSTRIFFTEAKGTRSIVYAMPVDGPPAVVYAPAKGIIGAGARVNAKGTHIGFRCESVDEAGEACVMTASGGQPVRVSRANLDLPKLPLPETKVIRWKSKDGMEIEGLLTYPAGYETGRKYPLILNIHGGPAGVFAESFVGAGSIYPLATLASKGYAILRPNPRGSGGYGAKFRFANLNDWGGGDYQDLMSGVDHVISLGVADPDHLGVMGWSYGGFMTSWVITQTDRFKGAAVGAGVTNLWSFTGTADIPGFLPDYFKGEPWDVFDNYRKHSPMNFVKNVKTPTLILHGENDLRVPTSQGYELYNAIKRLGVTSRMVVYPRMPHGPNEPKFMLDIMKRHIDWMDKYVR